MTNEDGELTHCKDFCPIFDAVESYNKNLFRRGYINCPVEMCNEMMRVYMEDKEYWETRRDGGQR